jgi:hypothetical protein
MSKSLLKTEILCPDLWEGDMSIMLPWMPEDNLVFLHFVQPTKGKIEGLFVVEKRLDMYDTRENGYVQRLRLRPHEPVAQEDHS